MHNGKRCAEDAPNAQFTCACPGECQHGKHPDYCAQCSLGKEGLKVYVRHTQTQIRANVELVLAKTGEGAENAPAYKHVGYWTDDSAKHRKFLGTWGPFDSIEDAEKSQPGWVEDV